MSDEPFIITSWRDRRARFVTLCQQLLAFAAVIAVLTPAARTVTMDVRPIPRSDAAARVGAGSASLAAYVKAAFTPSVVPTAPVDPTIDSYSLTATTSARALAGRATTGGSDITSAPLKITGYGAVGVTWPRTAKLSASDITITVRSEKNGRWSGWSSLAYDDDGGPDGAEAQHARPGTELLFVGDVDRAQVRIRTRSVAPAGIKVAVVDPGKPAATKLERPALDTSKLDGSAGDQTALLRKQPDGPSVAGAQAATLAAAAYTPKPQIYSRAQWGADERMRDKSSLHYGQVHAGFIHHTVQANDYTRAEVPGLIRADYAYHTQTRGWSDIGYNYLIDRFGRIWEGRYGGVDRDPVGAHTLGYNDDAFAASAIGNFQIAKPSAAMLQAYAALYAWKLSLAGVGATATHQWVTKRYFNAINGHRDAGQTLCPGQYMYAKIPWIRATALKIQQGWTGRQLESALAGGTTPDIIARRASDGEGVILPIKRTAAGTMKLGAGIDTGVNFTGASKIMRAGDWDRDGHADLLVQRKADPQDLYLYRGKGNGTFYPPTLLTKGLKGVSDLAAVGDFTGDGYPDLMGETATGPMMVWPGKGTAGFKGGYAVHSHIERHMQIGVGRWDGDGASDVLTRVSTTQVNMYYGNGPGGLYKAAKMTFDPRPYDQILGIASADGDWHSDLVLRVAKTGQMLFVHGTSSTAVEGVAIGYAKKFDLMG